MKNKKGLGSLLLSMVICGSLLSACGGNSNTSSKNSGDTEAKAKVAEIVFALPSFNRIPDDLSKVTNAINAITTEKIGVKVDFRLFGPADYAQKVNLALQSGRRWISSPPSDNSPTMYPRARWLRSKSCLPNTAKS